jgi:RNA polymerase sigma-B factor
LLQYVVCINMPIARELAGRYAGRGIDRDDLTQVAYTALTRAARKFRADLHTDLLSYAVPSIRGELKKYFRDHGWVIRPPRHIQEAQPLIVRADSELAQQLGRSPRPSEVAAHLGLDVQHVIEAMSAGGCFAPSSLDRLLTADNDEGTGPGILADVVSETDRAPAAEARLTLAPVVRQLPERDRQILYLRFVEERTQQEIGEAIGVTQMQVSRLLTRILRDLRRGLDPTSAHADR